MQPRGTEDRLIGWLQGELARRGLPDRLGDDAAFLSLEGDWAVTVDQQIEGTHFRSGRPARRIGRRLVAVNVSDLAACGARGGYALTALAAPRDFDFKSYFRGLLDGCQAHGLTLTGGDLAAAPRISAGLTVFGRRPPKGRWLRRDRARLGDTLWLGGTVGESALGRALLDNGAVLTPRTVRLPADVPRELRAAARNAVSRHIQPVPQTALGSWLGRRRRAAAIDVSDGLLLDLQRLARSSGVVCELDPELLPTSVGFEKLATRLGEDGRRLALAGGEDYVLLFALPPRIRPPREFGAVAIGRVISEPRSPTGQNVRILGAEAGSSRFGGWDHLAL